MLIRTVADMLERHPGVMAGLPFVVVDPETREVLRIAESQDKAEDFVAGYRSQGREVRVLLTSDMDAAEYRF